MERPIVETPVEARQGRKGTPVLYVLIIGTVLVVLAFAAISVYKPW